MREVINHNNFFAPYGMAMEGRNFVGGLGYRFGFNGKENIDEINGWQDYGERMYNRKIARFPSPDPLIVYGQQYAELSSYQFASNTPIRAIDLDGLEEYIVINWMQDGKCVGNTIFAVPSYARADWDEKTGAPSGTFVIVNLETKIDVYAGQITEWSSARSKVASQDGRSAFAKELFGRGLYAVKGTDKVNGIEKLDEHADVDNLIRKMMFQKQPPAKDRKEAAEQAKEKQLPFVHTPEGSGSEIKYNKTGKKPSTKTSGSENPYDWIRLEEAVKAAERAKATEKVSEDK